MEISSELHRLLFDASVRGKAISELGFFSKPFISQDGYFKGKVIKTYGSTKVTGMATFIKVNHNLYKKALADSGVILPETEFYIYTLQNKYYPIIVQEPFAQEQMLRACMELANVEEFKRLLYLILDDTIKFIYSRVEVGGIVPGFHPTLRNYALVENKPVYFDTFPPMLMPQQLLNNYIVEFAPVPIPFGRYIPSRFLNIVSDEYFDELKMLKGIVGSACRLRPELAEKTVADAVSWATAEIADVDLRIRFIKIILNPPKLPFIWVFFRKLFGKQGKPNIS